MVANKLSEDEIKDGVEACLENADELRGASALLAERGFAGVAMAIARIRIEELAKASLLLRMRDTEPGKRNWQLFWRKFKDHQSKWAEQLQRWLESRKIPVEERSALNVVKLMRVARAKNRGLYVDYQHGWTTPLDFKRRSPQLVGSYVHGGDRLAEVVRRVL